MVGTFCSIKSAWKKDRERMKKPTVGITTAPNSENHPIMRAPLLQFDCSALNSVASRNMAASGWAGERTMQISSLPKPARFKAQTTWGRAMFRAYIPYAAVPFAGICNSEASLAGRAQRTASTTRSSSRSTLRLSPVQSTRVNLV